MANPFRKIRAIDDRTLSNALGNHAYVLRGVSGATTTLLRERRLLLVLHVIEAAVLVWLVLR